MHRVRTYMAHHSTQSARGNKLLVVVLMLVIAILVLTAFELTNITFIFHKKAVLPAAGQYTKGEAQGNTNSQTTNTLRSATPEPGDQKSATASPSTTNLLAPIGNFVSNHQPGQNGSAMTETSTCNTSPGASCQIFFTQNGITKSLPAENTDRGGTAYWNEWTPSSYGLDSGSWQVKAVASLNGQTKTTIDAINLEIQ